MTDQLDQARKLEELARTAAMKKQQQNKEKPLVIKGVRHCLDCEITVSAVRVKSVDAVRCIDCQIHHEALKRHQRG